MNSSKEDLIVMTELKSPIRKLPRLKLKKSNQIHSPPIVSPARSTDRDVTSLFSVKKTSKKSSQDEDSTETVSELSEDLLSDSSMVNLSKSEGVTGRSSLRSSAKVNKLKKSWDKIRRESSQVDANIASTRGKFQLEEKRSERLEFSFFKFEKEDKEQDILELGGQFIQYTLPENLKFNITVAEEENVLFRNRLIRAQVEVVEHIPSPITLRSLKPDIQIQRGACTTYYPPNRLVDNLEEVVVVKNNILELSLYYVKFAHHPLFSLEHVLHEKLQRVFEKYSKLIENNRVDKLINELRARRDSADVTMKELRKLRENLFREGKNQRELMKLILNIWRAIKKVRLHQKFSNTNTRLVIKKEKSELSEDLEQYNSLFEELLQGALEGHNKAVHKKKLKELKANKAALQDDAIIKAVSEEEETDLEKPVLDVDKVNKLESELRAKFEESFRPPGEPSLTLCLKDAHIVSDDVDDDRENDRRKVTSTTRFTLKILCDNVPVCKSKPINLNDSFLLDFSEMFAIQLTNVPQFLSVEVFEHPKGLLKKKIAELKVEVPSPATLYKEAKVEQTHFERREIVHYKHAGVGSGDSLKKILEDTELSLDLKVDGTELYTKGILGRRIGWQGSEVKNEHSMTENGLLLERKCGLINKWGTLNIESFQDWLKDVFNNTKSNFEKAPFSPPMCSIKFYINCLGHNCEELKQFQFDTSLQPHSSSFHLQQVREEDSDYFRLSPHADQISFCKMEALQHNIRLQYLKLRDQNEIEFDRLPIPNRIREIPFNLLKDFKKRKTLEAVHDDEDDPDSLRDSGKRRLTQIYSRIFYACKGLDNNLSYESVVNEKYLIYLEDLIRISLKNLANWFRWQPKLTKPLPRIIKQAVQPQTPLPKPQNRILIKILSGKNVPERRDDGNAEMPQTFLEVTYEDFFTKTSSVTGSDPVWNELVELPLQYHHADYLNPDALNGSISFNLFDLVENRLNPNDETQPELKCWLGEVQIPVAALTTGLNLCGWFKVMKPPLLIGSYENRDERHLTKSPKHTNQENNAEETYVRLDLCISPNIPLLEPNMNDLPSNDVHYIKDHVIKWNDLFNSSFPNKKFNALALDTKGRTNCITRYIRPLEPPQLNNEEFDVTPDQCLRYVSLIPFTECNNFYKNVWLTSDQLLSFMTGSVVDHCVALTCFLLALKIDAYLLLGHGIPHGLTSYVLLYEYTRDSDLPNYFILDPFYNRKFNLADPFCPLQRVFCIANGENVWGNAQRTQNPAFLRFDLSRRSDWWPLFNDTLSAPTNFINNKINFASTRDFEDVERQLERKLKRKFSKWRPMERTNFNHRVAEMYKNALRYFEMSAMYGKNNTEALIEVNKAKAQYRVIGTILNVPFTTFNSISKKVKTLDLHVQESGVTNFSLSVFVQNYPGQVLSVWIFVGTVFDKFSL